MKRARLYYQRGKYVGRIRILYPDGEVEFIYDSGPCLEWQTPCYLRYQTKLNTRTTLKLMRRYDKAMGYRPAKFLGYT